MHLSMMEYTKGSFYSLRLKTSARIGYVTLGVSIYRVAML
jgi:hypothetical protein